jgi:hypothetical protein
VSPSLRWIKNVAISACLLLIAAVFAGDSRAQASARLEKGATVTLWLPLENLPHQTSGPRGQWSLRAEWVGDSLSVAGHADWKSLGDPAGGSWVIKDVRPDLKTGVTLVRLEQQSQLAKNRVEIELPKDAERALDAIAADGASEQLVTREIMRRGATRMCAGPLAVLSDSVKAGLYFYSKLSAGWNMFASATPPSAFLTVEAFHDGTYLAMHLGTYHKAFNDNVVGQGERLGRLFTEHVQDYLKYFGKAVAELPEVAGGMVTVTVAHRDFTSGSQYSTKEQVRLVFPRGPLVAYVCGDITSQELLNQSQVYEWDARVSPVLR